MPITKRLLIRPFMESDFDGFVALIRDKMAGRFAAYDEQFPTDEAELRRILAHFIHSDEFFALEEQQEKQLIGFITLNHIDDSTRNLGYCVHSAFQGRGYASEAVSGVIQFAAEAGVTKLVSATAIDNLPSVRLLQKMGFMETKRNMISFVNDDAGKPIYFLAGEYELYLN